MRDYDVDEPYVVIQERSSDVGSFLLGLAIGAGVALLFAPRTGDQIRGEIKRRVKDVGDKAAGSFSEAREKVEQRLESARLALEEKKQRMTDAVAAGRAAARQAARDARRTFGEAERGPTDQSSSANALHRRAAEPQSKRTSEEG
jgi:gas vesicle protein